MKRICSKGIAQEKGRMDRSVRNVSTSSCADSKAGLGKLELATAWVYQRNGVLATRAGSGDSMKT